MLRTQRSLTEAKNKDSGMIGAGSIFPPLAQRQQRAKQNVTLRKKPKIKIALVKAVANVQGKSQRPLINLPFQEPRLGKVVQPPGQKIEEERKFSLAGQEVLEIPSLSANLFPTTSGEES